MASKGPENSGRQDEAGRSEHGEPVPGAEPDTGEVSFDPDELDALIESVMGASDGADGLPSEDGDGGEIGLASVEEGMEAPKTARGDEAGPYEGTTGRAEKLPQEAVQPQHDAVPSPETSVEEGDIDALLAGEDDDKPLDGNHLDALIDAGESPESGQDLVEQASMDALVSSLASEASAEPTQPTLSAEGPTASDLEEGPLADDGDGLPAQAPSPEDDTGSTEGAVSQEMIDAIIASAGDGSEQDKSVGATPGPAAEAGQLVSQEDLDALIQESQEEEKQEQTGAQADLEVIGRSEKEPAPVVEEPMEEAPEPPPVSKFRKRFFRRKRREKAARVPREPGEVALYVRANFLKVSASVAALIVGTLATFTFLYTHQERVPDADALAALQGADIRRALQSAQTLMDEGAYRDAVAELDRAIAGAGPSAARTDAQFLRLEAAFKALPPDPTEREAETVHAEINELVEIARTHPRAAEALRWKAQLYERTGILHGARDVYDELLAGFGTAPFIDEVLMDAASLATTLEKPKAAAGYLQRLLRRFPGSPLAGEAKLRLADSFAAAGNPEDARVLYVRCAQAQAGTPLGAQAVARLGQLAFEQGEYQSAIDQLESYLDMATTGQGNDTIYLQLARSYRAAGQLNDARRVLNELIDFFPENETTPLAFVEMSQVLDELGSRKEAVRLASQTARLYPRVSAVLENQAQLLESSGDMAAAGRAWMAAYNVGATNAGFLLAAARAFHRAGALSDAVDAYTRLLQVMPVSAQSSRAGIELAQVEYEMGQIRKAVQRLEDLASATQGRPQRLPVLIALGEMYEDLGFKERVAQVFRDVAVFTTEPEVLAEAATALINAGAEEEGTAVAQRVDVTKLKDTTAYALEMAHGEALLRVDPRRALEKMELAFERHPGQRTPDGDQKLLEAYLATDNSARARALVMNLDAHVRRNPVDAPRLVKAAIAWADYLYERGDSRAAADAYALAIGSGVPDSSNVWWAKYQRANALLKLADFEGCVTLYDEVAATDTPWAEQADIMADYARLEQHLRGTDPIPSSGNAG